LRVAGQVSGQHLERDRSAERIVPTGVDHGHPAAAELALDRVPAHPSSPLSCFLWPLPCSPCFPWPVSTVVGGGCGAGGRQTGARPARSLTPARNDSWSSGGTAFR